MASHLQAQARPRNTPASTRRQRMPGGRPAAIAAPALSRSTTSMPKAASTQNMTKMSRIAVRDSTSSSPSRAISSPATQPSRVERVIRLAIRAVIRIDTVPTTATANRQPNGVRPNSHSPAAIIALPSGGWTTYSPGPVKMLLLPRSSRALTFEAWLYSTPWRRIE